MTIRTVCVFAGSSPGARYAYASGAQALGDQLARRGIDLVYGGGAVGLMGAIADAVLAGGTNVTGIIPRFLLDKEVGHAGLSSLEVVETMHQRKQRMFECADAFVMLPGGMGTLEETFEILTWAQLGFHDKPVGILNVAGYYDELLAFLDTAVTQRFIKPQHRQLFIVKDNPEQLLDAMQAWIPSKTDKWIDLDIAKT